MRVQTFQGIVLTILLAISDPCTSTIYHDNVINELDNNEMNMLLPSSVEVDELSLEEEAELQTARRLKSSSSSISHECSMSSCMGINVLSAIEKDFKPWSDKGGITARDIDAAERKLQKVEGFIRVSIVDGVVHASHLAHSWGTRDGVFLVSILEMMREDPKSIPQNVEFVLSTMDRSQLETSSRSGDIVPFAISFATSPGFLDVPIPDPSFWAWPEMLIPPYWEIMHSEKILPWEEKTMRAFWRGGTARNSGLRETMIHCGKDSRHRGKGVTFDLKNAVRNWPKTWAGPMDTCQYKLAVFAQGYGFTSAKERLLACGSVPIFLERDKMDTYFGRWLKEDVHFKRMRPETMCADLDEIIDWVLKNDKEAKMMGDISRKFAEGFFNKEMLNGYISAVLHEIASLEKHTPSTRGMSQITLKNVGHIFDVASKNSGDKGATKDGNKGGPVDAAIAALEGKPCPEERCPKCCFRSPKAVAASGQDVEAEASEGSWWRRHKNSSFAFWRVQKAKEEEAAGISSGDDIKSIIHKHSSPSSSSSSNNEEEDPSEKKEKYLGSHIHLHHHRHDNHGGTSVVKKKQFSDEEEGKPTKPEPGVAKANGAKAYWKTKLEKHRREKEGAR